MKERSRNVLFAVVVGILMAASSIGIMFVNYGSDSDTLSYKGHKFSRQADGSVVTELKGKQAVFMYFPAEVESISLNKTIIERINSTRMIYLTSDYYSNFSQAIGVAEYNLGYALQDIYSIFAVQGFFQNATNLPVVTCDNATLFVPVLSFQEGNKTAIYENAGGCIIIESDNSEGFIKARDRLFYGISGVI